MEANGDCRGRKAYVVQIIPFYSIVSYHLILDQGWAVGSLEADLSKKANGPLHHSHLHSNWLQAKG